MPATTSKARWNSGNLLESNIAGSPSPVYNIRKRFTLAEVNAGATLLPAVPGIGYRMIQCSIIAIGGAATAGTSVDIGGTQTTAKLLSVFAQASMTQSTELRAGDTGSTILADGASFLVNDANTAITVAAVGTFTTATHFDVIFEYAMEHA